MNLSSNDPFQPDDPDAQGAQRVAELAIELLEAARNLGNAALIAAAELAAHQAAVALAETIGAVGRKS